ncbi:hypothetical protein P9112_006934 [Eukaryota sp. TZLM1-RC]
MGHPETILKRRKTLNRMRAEALEREHLKRIAAEPKPSLRFKRAEYFVSDFRNVERESFRHKKVSKSKCKEPIPDDTKVLLAIRIPGPSAIHPNSLRILQNLRLKEVYSAVFIKPTTKQINLLRSVEAHIIWGVPSIDTVRELVLKRGCTIIKKERIPLHDNRLVEEHLGSSGLICVEDIIHELVTGSDNFPKVSSFLAPFKLHAAKSETGKDEIFKGGFIKEELDSIVARLL